MKKQSIRISRKANQKIINHIIERLYDKYSSLNAVKAFDENGEIITKLPIEIKLVGNKQKINEFKGSFKENFF